MDRRQVSTSKLQVLLSYEKVAVAMTLGPNSPSHTALKFRHRKRESYQDQDQDTRARPASERTALIVWTNTLSFPKSIHSPFKPPRSQKFHGLVIFHIHSGYCDLECAHSYSNSNIHPRPQHPRLHGPVSHDPAHRLGDQIYLQQATLLYCTYWFAT